MKQTIIIGRNGDQAFKINADGVSQRHAEITIADGKWYLRDLGSTNHTYIRNSDGTYTMIGSMAIAENTVIRLGSNDIHGFTFMAHRVIAAEEDFSYEFAELTRLKRECEEREQAVAAKIETHGWISKGAGVIVMMLLGIIGYLDLFDISITARYICISFAPLLVGFLFKSDKHLTTAARNIRKNVLICPKCNRPLSDYEIEKKQCLVCKAN